MSLVELTKNARLSFYHPFTVQSIESDPYKKLTTVRCLISFRQLQRRSFQNGAMLLPWVCVRECLTNADHGYHQEISWDILQHSAYLTTVPRLSSKEQLQCSDTYVTVMQSGRYHVLILRKDLRPFCLYVELWRRRQDVNE